jgi:hypothetical protein
MEHTKATREPYMHPSLIPLHLFCFLAPIFVG